MRRLASALGLLLLGASAASTAGCGKSHVVLPMDWYVDLEAGAAVAKAQNKPLVVFFGADWDTAWKEIEHVTLVDPEVRMLLGRHFVSVHVDATDDENPTTRRLQERFKVVGDPTIVIVAADGQSELARVNEFVKPARMAQILRDASKPDAAREARYEASIRRRAEEARWQREVPAMTDEIPMPTVIIALPPDGSVLGPR